MTSSVSLLWNRCERNSVPSTGRSPRPGNLLSRFWMSLDIRPPIANDCPLPSSTVVSARRVARPGMTSPLTVIEPSQNPVWAKILRLGNGPGGSRRPAAAKTGTTNETLDYATYGFVAPPNKTLLLLGNAYWRVGRKDDARRAWQHLVESFPKAAQAGEARAQLASHK